MARRLPERSKVQCKSCNKFDWKIRKSLRKRRNNFVYVNERSKEWYGYLCPECHHKAKTEYNRRRGIRSLDDIPNHNVQVNRKAEREVERFLKGNGFEVLGLTTTKGPDVVVRKGKRTLYVEVKRVFRMKHSNTWRVTGVEPARRNDDFIAMVFPNKRIVLERMDRHLKKCAPSGIRTVTEMME
jgi:hypothetical protein